MKNILRRLEIVEHEINAGSVIPDQERVLGIPYTDGDEEEFECRLQEKMTELKSKYGQNISKDDFLIIRIRKFARQAKEG